MAKLLGKICGCAKGDYDSDSDSEMERFKKKRKEMMKLKSQELDDSTDEESAEFENDVDDKKKHNRI